MAAKNAKTIKNDRLAKRLSFAKSPEPIELPDLLSLQTESFDWLVGAPAWREKEGPSAKTGLEEIFEEISPIEDSANSSQDAKMGLAFGNPELYDPSYTPDECKTKGKSYTQPLYIKAEFTNYLTGEIKSQTVFMGDFPVMTEKGTSLSTAPSVLLFRSLFAHLVFTSLFQPTPPVTSTFVTTRLRSSLAVVLT